ncbi:MAG: lysophospholipid acyltransferase family protein [Pseudomonadota bacterium]
MKVSDLIYYLYTVFILMWVIVVIIVFGTAAIVVSFFDKKGNLAHIVARWWGKSILFASRIQVSVKGFSNIDPDKSYIFMPNHMSNCDIPVILAHLKVQFRWLAKAELFRVPLFGFAMKRAGYISIDRSNRRSAFESLARAAQTIRNGRSVLIFPEGTRSRDQSIKAFKKGGFVLAVESGVPIVPVVIHGTWRIMSKNGLMIRPGNVTLEILEPIETKEYSRKTKDELLERVRGVIVENFEKGKTEP